MKHAVESKFPKFEYNWTHMRKIWKEINILWLNLHNVPYGAERNTKCHTQLSYLLQTRFMEWNFTIFLKLNQINGSGNTDKWTWFYFTKLNHEDKSRKYTLLLRFLSGTVRKINILATFWPILLHAIHVSLMARWLHGEFYSHPTKLTNQYIGIVNYT